MAMLSQRDQQIIETVFTANTSQFERAMDRYANGAELRARRIEKAFQDSNRRVAKSAQSLNDDLKRAFTIAAVVLATRQVGAYEEAWRNTRNTVNQYSEVLGDAEVATSAIAAVANDAGVALRDLDLVIGGASRAAERLDRSGDEVLDFGEAVSKAAQLANNGAAGVSGAMLQLSQAIDSPRVQLQEFNSVVEGTPRLAEAFAQGLLGAEASISDLRREIADGNVSGEALFDAILSQLPELREEFEKLELGPLQAINRLNNRVAEFAGTNEGVRAGAQGFSQAVEFAANNVDAFADVIVVAGAALAGAFGVSAVASTVKGLSDVTKGVTGAARAMAILEASTKVFGGPVAVAIAALAAGVAYLALNAETAANKLEKVETSLERFNRASEAVKTDTERLAQLNIDLGKAIEGQQAQIEATKRADIAALNARIAKNKELQGIFAAQARVDLAEAEAELRRERSAASAFSDYDLLTDEERAASARSGNAFRVDRETLFQDVDFAERRAQAEQAALEAIRERQDAGEAIAQQEIELLRAAANRLELEERVAALRDQVNLAKPAIVGDPLGEDMRGLLERVRSTDTEGSETSPDKARRAGLKLIADLNKALADATDSERQAIQRTLDERLAAIEKVKLTEDEARQARLAAELLYDQQLEEIRAEEDRRAEEAAQREAEAAARQIDLIDQVYGAREATFGLVSALIEREYERDRARLEAELAGHVDLADALVALEEDKNERLRQVREDALQGGDDFVAGAPGADAFDAEIARIETDAALRVEAIRNAYGDEIDAHREAQDQIIAIQEAAADRINEVNRERLLGMVATTGNAFGQIAATLKKAGREQSDAYKLMVAANKVTTGVQLGINLAANVSEASKVGPPQNIPLIAMALAQGAQIAALFAQGSQGFQRGGYTGDGPLDEVAGAVHRKEFVHNAQTTAYYGRDVMERMARRELPREALARYAGSQTRASQAVSRASQAITQSHIHAPRSMTVSFGDVRYQVEGGGVTMDLVRDLQAAQAAAERRLAGQVASLRGDMDGLVADAVVSGGTRTARALEQTYALGRAA